MPLQFYGAAQQPFGSFMELARFSLNTYWTNWYNTSNPTSHILPPRFSFINPDKSDYDIEEIKGKVETQKQAGAAKNFLSSLQRPVIDRFSDAGEFTVYHALWALVQEKVQAPFLAIHRLDLGKIKGHVHEIFPQAQADAQEKFKTMMREYDFVLIGPKIGIIVIEVKSSAFTKKKDFAARTRKLPDHIVDGVKQLKSFDLEYFQACSGVQVPSEVQVRRVLFTPNLGKARFNDWYKNLDEVAKEKVDKLLISGGITHWFKEGLVNSDSDSLKPDLYTRLREMIEADGFQIPQNIYETYGLVISGLASAVVHVLQNQIMTSTDRLSTSSAILRDVAALDSQDPLQKLQLLSLNSTKPRRLKLDPDAVIQIHSKLVLLTPEQQAVLNGPNRQFIIGPPGTGKTIILQAKALQLLKKGKRVLIFTTDSFEGKYQNLFEDHGFSNYEIRTNDIYDPPTSLFAEFAKRLDAGESLWKILDVFSVHVKNIAEMRHLLTDFDAVLIDDAFDHSMWFRTYPTYSRLTSIMLLMTLARTNEFNSKVVWTACDGFAGSDWEVLTRIFEKIIQGEQASYFTVAPLHRVMRSSENVFLATYSPDVMEQLVIKPVIGHKIHGFSASVHLHKLSEDEALLEILKHTVDAVKRFREEGFDYDHIAVILGGDLYIYLYFAELLQKSIEDAAPSPLHLNIRSWNEVSSLEWPIVIYIAIFLSDKEGTRAAYHRSRACSRSIMQIYEIIAYEVEVVKKKLDDYAGQ